MVDSRVIATDSTKQSKEDLHKTSSPQLDSIDNFSTDDVFTSLLVDTKSSVQITTSPSAENDMYENLNQVNVTEKEMMVVLLKRIRQMNVRLDVSERRNRVLSAQVDSLSAKLNDQLLPVVKSIIQIRSQIRSSSISDVLKRSGTGASVPWSSPISDDKSYSTSSAPTSSHCSITSKHPLYTQIKKKRSSKIYDDRPLPSLPTTPKKNNHEVDQEVKAVYELLKPLENSINNNEREKCVFKEELDIQKCSNKTFFSKIKRKMIKKINLPHKTSLPRSSEVLTRRPYLKSCEDKRMVQTASRKSFDIHSLTEVFEVKHEKCENLIKELIRKPVNDFPQASTNVRSQRSNTTNNPPNNQFYELDKILETTRMLTLQRPEKNKNKQFKDSLKNEYCFTAPDKNEKNTKCFENKKGLAYDFCLNVVLQPN